MTTGEDVAITACQADFVELVKDMESGRAAQALERYRGRFLPKDDLCSAGLRDWRDHVEVETAEAVSHALQEQSCVCGSSELGRLIEVANELLAVHPHLAAAQIACLEAHSRLGHIHDVKRFYARFQEDSPVNKLPPIDSFLGRRASPQPVASVRFAGREAEMEVLQRCWTEASAGLGSVAVILGEPGIGKTRLADHFLRRVAIRGGATWIARCCAATQRLPYSVISEFIRENVAGSSGHESSRIIQNLSAPAIPQSEVAADERRYQLTEALTSLVLRKCENQPLAIFIDDAQWADEYTALLLSYWAYRLRNHAVLILLTVRTEEAEPPPEWIFSDLGRVTELNLSRIGIDAASEIVTSFESANQVVLDKKLRDAVLWQSGGRPFLLLEALTATLSDDMASKPTAESVLTESAESVLRRRFRNLPTEATSVLSALAVWGHEISADVLSRIAAIQDDTFVGALDLLHSRGIAYWLDGSVAFPHDLMREAAYRSLMPATRALYHRRAAEEIGDRGGPEGLVAQHYAKAGDSHLAASHALKAADDALGAHAYADYEYYCKLCIEHGPVTHKRQAADKLSRFLVRVGRTAEIDAISSLLQGGSPEHVLLMEISHFERDLAAGDCGVIDLLERAKAIVRVASGLNDLTAAPVVATLIDVAFDAGADDFGLQVVGALLPQPQDEASEAQIALESIVSVWRGVTENIGSGLRQAESALTRLPQPASPTTEALCIASYGTLQLLSGKVGLARSSFESALKLAVAAGDHRRQLSILNNHGIALLESGDTVGARKNFERVLTAPNVHSRIRGYGNLAILQYEVGDLGNAARAAEAVLSMNAAYGSPPLDILGHSILGLIDLDGRNMQDASYHADQVRLLIDLSARRSGDSTYSTLLLTRISLDEKRYDAAIELLDKMIKQAEPRDKLCAMRLKCELAAVIGTTDPDIGFAIVRDVIAETSIGGASLIGRRADDVRRALAHC